MDSSALDTNCTMITDYNKHQVTVLHPYGLKLEGKTVNYTVINEYEQCRSSQQTSLKGINIYIMYKMRLYDT